MLFALFFVAATEPPPTAAAVAEPRAQSIILRIDTSEAVTNFLTGRTGLTTDYYTEVIVQADSLSSLSEYHLPILLSKISAWLTSGGELKIGGKMSESLRNQLELAEFETNNPGGTEINFQQPRTGSSLTSYFKKQQHRENSPAVDWRAYA